MIVVGLTGSMGSGKSTVAQMFQELGAYLIDWDVLAREVVRPHMKTWQEIVDYFGRDVLNDDLTLNRPKLGSIVFNDPEKLARLNQITHPAVIEADAARTEEIKRTDPQAIVVKDVPLLIEARLHNQVDEVVVVMASQENQLQRLTGRGISPEDARQRIAAQMPLAEKVKVADFVIDNDGTLEDTRRQVKQIFESLSSPHRGRGSR